MVSEVNTVFEQDSGTYVSIVGLLVGGFLSLLILFPEQRLEGGSNNTLFAKDSFHSSVFSNPFKHSLCAFLLLQ